MGVGLKAKKSEWRVCLWCPWERKWRTENTELRARLLLRKPGHPASPSQGPLDTFPPAALRKQTRHCAERLSVCTPVEYGHAPSTGCLPLNIRIHFVCGRPPNTFPKQGTVRAQELHTVITNSTELCSRKQMSDMQQLNLNTLVFWGVVFFFCSERKCVHRTKALQRNFARVKLSQGLVCVLLLKSAAVTLLSEKNFPVGKHIRVRFRKESCCTLTTQTYSLHCNWHLVKSQAASICNDTACTVQCHFINQPEPHYFHLDIGNSALTLET